MEKKIELVGILDQHKKGVHLREISRLINTGLPNVVRYVDILEKEGVVKKKKEANLLKVELKKGQITIAYLKQLHTVKFLSLPKKVQITINDLLIELEIKPIISLIFGSYARGDYMNKSDIDILLVFQNFKDVDIENTAKRISLRSNQQINPVYMNYKDFEKNFLNKEHAFSNEIRKDVIILNGIEYYYELLWRFLQ